MTAAGSKAKNVLVGHNAYNTCVRDMAEVSTGCCSVI